MYNEVMAKIKTLNEDELNATRKWLEARYRDNLRMIDELQSIENSITAVMNKKNADLSSDGTLDTAAKKKYTLCKMINLEDVPVPYKELKVFIKEPGADEEYFRVGMKLDGGTIDKEMIIFNLDAIIEALEKENREIDACKKPIIGMYTDAGRKGTETYIKKPRNEYNMYEEISEFLSTYDPVSLKAYLDKYVIGQDEAKQTITIAVIEHLQNVQSGGRSQRKKNVLMVGPSGCGKTEIMRALRAIYPLPIVFCDASGVTQDGWNGEKSVNTLVEQLIRDGKTFMKTRSETERKPISNRMINLGVESGIMFIDEIDKAVNSKTSSGGENVAFDIQSEMLKLFEDGNISAEGGSVDMTNILCICAGAFSFMYNSMFADQIGFNPDHLQDGQEASVAFSHEDLINAGMTAELAGRIPVVTTLYPLTKDDLTAIMKNENNIEIISFIMTMEDVFGRRVEFSDEAYGNIANDLLEETGAREIPAVLERLKRDIVYGTEPGSDIVITGSDNFYVKADKVVKERSVCV